MEMENLVAAKYVKNISKEKVTLLRIESYLKKTNYTVNKEDLINLIYYLNSRGNLKI